MVWKFSGFFIWIDLWVKLKENIQFRTLKNKFYCIKSTYTLKQVRRLLYCIPTRQSACPNIGVLEFLLAFTWIWPWQCNQYGSEIWTQNFGFNKIKLLKGLVIWCNLHVIDVGHKVIQTIGPDSIGPDSIGPGSIDWKWTWTRPIGPFPIFGEVILLDNYWLIGEYIGLKHSGMVKSSGGKGTWFSIPGFIGGAPSGP